MIITNADELRVECSDVQPDEVDYLRVTLERELRRSYELGRPGIGLAAPQIGAPKNMAIVRISTPYGQRYNIDLINCKIKEKYDLMTFENEGCLSFPDVNKTTERYNEIYVVDNFAEPKSFIATGLLAACIQHELDHLEGKLLIDF